MGFNEALEKDIKRTLEVPEYTITIQMKDGTKHVKTTRTNDLLKAVNDWSAWCIAPDDMGKIVSIQTEEKY